MKHGLALVCALLLSGCANHPEWSKEGTAPEVVARALADCQSLAREATDRDTNIMTDIMATRGQDWQRTGVMEPHVQNFNAETRNRGDDVVNRCMIGKGYVPGG